MSPPPPPPPPPREQVWRIQPLDGRSPARDCVGKTHFLFGNHTKGGGVDFYLEDVQGEGPTLSTLYRTYQWRK